MMDFFFFVKTFIFTAAVVLLLQIQIGKKTVEIHVRDSVKGSIAASFIGNAAHGGALVVKDTFNQFTQRIKANMWTKKKSEKSEVKASRFQWGWEKSSKAAEVVEEVDPD